MNTNPSPSNLIRSAPRLIAGLGILALGIVWTLDNLDIVNSRRITEWWPLILIAIGLVRFFDPYKGKVASVIFIVVGTLILLNNLAVPVNINVVIPLAIAAVGGKLVWDALRRKSMPTYSGSDPGSMLSAFALWSGVKRQVTSQEFRGGDATAIMGGVELDLRKANVRDGEQAIIDAFALWGGVEITVPENWRIVSKVMPLLGGYEDKTAPRDAVGPVLIVQGSAIMGAVVVKN
jgi:predicted membrane protein